MHHNHQPLALRALAHHDRGDHCALNALMKERQATAPPHGAAGLHGVMEDHSLIIDGGDTLIFSWFQDGRWHSEHRAQASDHDTFAPANRWHEPMYRWPSPASMLNRALLRLETKVATEMASADQDLEHYQPDPEYPLVTAQEVEAMMPGLHSAATKATQTNHGDLQLHALDEAESWGADDLEHFFKERPDATARLTMLMQELMRVRELEPAA